MSDTLTRRGFTLATLGAALSPAAPALANAIRDAIGVRPTELPMSRDRLWRLIRA